MLKLDLTDKAVNVIVDLFFEDMLMFRSVLRLSFLPPQKRTSLLVWLISSVTAPDTQGAAWNVM